VGSIPIDTGVRGVSSAVGVLSVSADEEEEDEEEDEDEADEDSLSPQPANESDRTATAPEHMMTARRLRTLMSICLLLEMG
jgi:hypothetical protein